MVVALKRAGLSHRDISEKVWGVRTRASTVWYILRRRGLVGVDTDNPQNQRTGAPKILVFDIETAPILASVWGIWQQNVGLNMIKNDWYVLSWSAKWVGDNEVMYQGKEATWEDDDDYELLKSIHSLLDEADIVVTQNGKKFDVKKLNARFIMNGFQPPSSYKHIDTLQIAKRHFGFTSNKLEFMTDKLCKKYKKLKHGKFPGFELWKQCLRGNQEAWDEMKEYNIHDVLSLEELIFILAPWSNQIPNMDMYHDGDDNKCFCGSTDWTHNGYAYTNVSKFDRFKCDSCGAEKRGRTNLFGKEKRETLMMNVT